MRNCNCNDREYNVQTREGRYFANETSVMEGSNLPVNKTVRSLTSTLRSDGFDDTHKFVFIVSSRHIHVFVLLFSRFNSTRLHQERDAS